MPKLKVEVHAHTPLLANAPEMGKGIKRNKKQSGRLPPDDKDVPTHDEMLKDTARSAHRLAVHRWVSGEISDKQLHQSRTRMKAALAECAPPKNART